MALRTAVEPVAQAGRPLELELVGRRRASRRSSRWTIVVGVAVEEVEQLARPARRSRSLSISPTHGPRALLDVEQQARPARAAGGWLNLLSRAGADRERAQQQVERLADGVGVGVRAEVADALALAAPHHHRPRPLVVEGDGEERVALVVAQPDVEPGPVLLDEAVLEHQRLDLVAHLDPLDRLGRGHHLGGARVAGCAGSGSSSTAAGAGSRPCRRRSPGRRRP